MSRRAVRTVSAEVDLSGFLTMPAELPLPWNAAAVFRRTAPLELEIGSGKGLFIRSAAEQCPQHNFLGIEIGAKYARFAAAGIARRSLPNAVIVCGDAASILTESVPDDSLEAVHVYFPDPWWKRAHRKRRILRMEVLQLIERRLRPGGTLHFWTDVEEYFRTTLKLLAQTTTLQGPFDVPQHEAKHEFDYRTHYERRTRLHNETVYRAEFRKKTGAAPNGPFPLP